MTKFQISPNQKVVVINKAKSDKEHIYAIINVEAMNKAAHTLDYKSFELWCYFARNQDGHTFALSNKAVNNEFGMSKDAYDGAIAKLIEHGYLVQVDRLYYSFNEFPIEKEEEEQQPEYIDEVWGSF